MGKYSPPRYPSAIAARRNGDLRSREREKAGRSQRRDRRRSAFRTMKNRYRAVREYRARCKTCSEAEAARQTSEH